MFKKHLKKKARKEMKSMDEILESMENTYRMKRMQIERQENEELLRQKKKQHSNAVKRKKADQKKKRQEQDEKFTLFIGGMFIGSTMMLLAICAILMNFR
jgi:uncharacterized protein YyaL (SSP411 family)